MAKQLKKEDVLPKEFFTQIKKIQKLREKVEKAITDFEDALDKLPETLIKK